jgi:hypothetical protein
VFALVLGSGSGGCPGRRQPGRPCRPGSGGSGRRDVTGGVHSDCDQPTCGGDRIGARRSGGRSVQHLAGSDIEAGAVPRAAQHAVVHQVTLAQGAALMGALVVEGVQAALAVDDGHPAAPDPDGGDRTDRQIPGSEDLDRTCHGSALDGDPDE